MTQTDQFYSDLPRESAFDQLTQSARYRALPSGWWIGVSDVVNSTGLVQSGQYKTVNMVGAAVISATMNALKGEAFPFVFGGDGAGFAVGPQHEGVARDALARVAGWADAEFGLTLRVGLVPVEDVRASGAEVRVARFQASEGADYAMFEGGGLHWAETQMKAGRYLIAPAGKGILPDLTGLSCRWSPMPSRQGTILSLLVAPVRDAPPEQIAKVYHKIISLAATLERGGHPASSDGPGSDWPPQGAKLEAHASHGTGSLTAARAKALFESLIAWGLIRTGIKLGGFDARRYARIVGENADFRKLDDGLKMTLDCDPATQAQIEAVLAEAEAADIIRYGIATQGEAMMTCIVPSILSDDHVHFVDGAGGGYTLAASKMKRRFSQSAPDPD